MNKNNELIMELMDAMERRVQELRSAMACDAIAGDAAPKLTYISLEEIDEYNMCGIVLRTNLGVLPLLNIDESLFRFEDDSNAPPNGEYFRAHDAFVSELKAFLPSLIGCTKAQACALLVMRFDDRVYRRTAYQESTRP